MKYSKYILTVHGYINSFTAAIFIDACSKLI